MNSADVHGVEEKPRQPCVKGESIKADQRLAGWSAGVTFGRINAEPAPGNFNPVEDRDAEALQFDPSMEAGLQGFNDARLENGTGPPDYLTGGYQESRHDQDHRDGDPNPQPAATDRGVGRNGLRLFGNVSLAGLRSVP